jgi:hypothetical protein
MLFRTSTARRRSTGARLSGAGAVLGAAVFMTFDTASAQVDRRVRIVNASTHAMVGFYATNVDMQDWQESLLGEGTLPAGSAIVLDFEDGSGYCRFRFRAVFDDGLELVRRSVNICEVGTYRYTD